MKDTETMLREILAATDTAWQARDLRTMINLSDPTTVAVIYGVLQRRPLQIVLREAGERRIAPASKEALAFLDAHTFASSKEIAEQFGLAASSASNRLSALETARLVRRVFAFSPVGGGRRYYYGRTGRAIPQSEIETFRKQLGPGGLILAESDASSD